MDNKRILSTQEAQIMGSILLIQDDAYVLNIIKFIKEKTGRKISFGSMYKSFKVLKTKGFLKSELLKSTPNRGGRRKECYDFTDLGMEAYKKYYEQMDKFRVKIMTLKEYGSTSLNI